VHVLANHRLLVLIPPLLVAVACGESAGPSGEAEPAVNTPWPITAFPEDPEVMQDVPEARIELGKLLFYETLLSRDRETACATCHSEVWGMSDSLARSVGHGAGLLAGPGREGPNNMRRNAPTLYNLAFRETLFLDGRTATLEEQALLPMLEADEMDRDPADAVAEMATIPEYVERFAEAFPDDPAVSVDNMASALSAFQRTMISKRSPYDAYLRGDLGAVTDEVIEGMFRFADMGCDGCHAPPLFESERFENRNLPAIDGVVDDGRMEVTGLEEDRGKFRVPTLRNAAFTNPYFHDGSMRKLEDAVEHELAQSGMPYTDEDVRLIKLFIDKALRDESREPSRPLSLPSGLPLPLDGTAITR
jgi:cytochrome c peroxidase